MTDLIDDVKKNLFKYNKNKNPNTNSNKLN